MKENAIFIGIAIFCAAVIVSGAFHVATRAEKAPEKREKADPCVEGYDALSLSERFECAQKKHRAFPWQGIHLKAAAALRAHLGKPDYFEARGTNLTLADDSEEKQYYKVSMYFRTEKEGRRRHALVTCDLKTGEALEIRIDN